MKPTECNNLSAEDAAVILELAPILDIAAAKRLPKGSARKFYIETTHGEKRLLNIISDMSFYEWMTGYGEPYGYIASFGINTMQQVDTGTFHGGQMAYQAFTWIIGEDLLDALPRMNPAEQFSAGLKAGAFLRKLHTLPPKFGYDPEPWEIYFKWRVRELIKAYNANPAKSPEGDVLAQYLLDNQHLLVNRPKTFIHGDWNTENIMLTPDGQIALIDLGDCCGDPWRDFWELICHDKTQTHFYTGHVKGYFDGDPPPEFFRLHVYYAAFGTLEWYPDNAKDALYWLDALRNPVPAWYLRDYAAE
jgi:serine/threonine-protein kinase